MAASLASMISRSDDARSRVARDLGSAALSSRARLSPEGAESFFLLSGEDAVAHRLGDALPEPLLQGAVDVLVGGAGALGDGPQGLPEGGLVEGVGTGGLGGELDHLLVAGLVGLPAFPGGPASGDRSSGRSTGRYRTGIG